MAAKMCALGFCWVLFVDVTEVFHQSLFEWSFSLTNIYLVTMSAFQAINDIGAVAAKIGTAFI